MLSNIYNYIIDRLSNGSDEEINRLAQEAVQHEINELEDNIRRIERNTHSDESQELIKLRRIYQERLDFAKQTKGVSISFLEGNRSKTSEEYEEYAPVTHDENDDFDRENEEDEELEEYEEDEDEGAINDDEKTYTLEELLAEDDDEEPIAWEAQLERRGIEEGKIEQQDEEQQALFRGERTSVGSPEWSRAFNENKKQRDEVLKRYMGTSQYLKAHNGTKSHLPAYLWTTVRTPNFKAWFGDWENDPEHSSKILD